MTFLSVTPEPASLTPEQQFAHDIALVMQIAIEHHHKGEFSEAQSLYEAILSAKADHADANYNLAVLKVQTDHANDAIAHFEVAIGSNPHNGQYWVSYINALVESGQTSAAWVAVELAQQRGVTGPALNGLIAQMATPGLALPTAPASPSMRPEQVLQIQTKVAAAESAPDRREDTAGGDLRRASRQELNRHSTLYMKDRVAESLALAKKLVQRYPSDGASWRTLMISLHKDGQYRETVEAARKTVEFMPDDVLSRTVLADTLRSMGSLTEAEMHCRTVLKTHPNHAEAQRILGLSLVALGRLSEGLAACRRAVDLAPHIATAHATLGFALMDQGAVLEAESSFRRALELDPMDALTNSNILFCFAHNEAIDAKTLTKEHRLFGKRHEARIRALWPRHTNDRAPERKLQIGFISGDLFNHAVASYLVPVIKHLTNDPTLSLHFYYNHTTEDAVTAILRSHADGWHPIFGLNDTALADKIRKDRIDILIDLSGHTARNRLVAMARKPAPIQASWIGYPATTGLQAVDYYLADRFLTPPGEIEEQFVEKIVRLPAIAPFMPPQNCPPINALPALHNGFITFGSFNRLNKLRPDVVALWASIMQAMPTSRMILGATSQEADKTTLTGWFAAEGIDASRLAFRTRANTPVYLQQHHQVDLCLDTFPYAGSTTTLNALWMGVPTLTMPGSTLSSRGGAGWLQHLGLDEFIARDREEFVEKGIELTRDVTALHRLRISLRERCLESAAFQPDVIAAGLSVALRTMWKRWCAGEAPASFEAELPADWRRPIAASSDSIEA